MHYTIIDMEKDPRCGQFAYFRAMQYPFASVTVEVDITDMMTARGSRPFFLSLLYAVVRAANAVPQLRRRILLFLRDRREAAGSDYFRVPYSRQEMAEVLGVNRSALSRELGRMQREGLLEFYRSSFRLKNV